MVRGKGPAVINEYLRTQWLNRCHIGGTFVDFDVTRGPEQDLADDAVWERVVAALKAGKYCAIIATPPRDTFGRHWADDDGPAPLRERAGTGRYGIKGLCLEDQKSSPRHLARSASG